jgi:hypothetical protein
MRPMLRPARTAIALGVAVATAAGSGAQAASRGGAAARPRPAHAARVMGVRDEGSLHYVSDDATLIVDEGGLSGTLPGRSRVYFTYNGSPNVSARFAIHAAGGAVEGRASCLLHNPNSPTPSFRGALQITGGSGRYAHARGSGELFGIFHRRGYGLIVQAIGRLRY